MDHKRSIQIHEEIHTTVQKSIKEDATLQTELKYKNYRNCLTKIKRKAKIDYYTNRCYALKSNMKKL